MKTAHIEESPATSSDGAGAPQLECMTYTITEAARLLGISRSLAFELAGKGELPGAVRISRRRYIVSRKALEAFINGAL
jgi:excisionase family DNA binding protein